LLTLPRRGAPGQWRRATVKDGIEKHLRHTPTKLSKSRIKRLREMMHPEYRLRLNEHRVFYDVDGQNVVVLAIVPKGDAGEWLNTYGVKSS